MERTGIEEPDAVLDDDGTPLERVVVYFTAQREGPGSETFWARRVGEDSFVIKNVPWFAYDLKFRRYGADGFAWTGSRSYAPPAVERLEARLGPALRLAGLEQERYRFHDLRHTCVSRLVAAGADVKLVQAVAGHSDPLITLKRYSHLLDARVIEAAGRFDPARTEEREPQAP